MGAGSREKRAIRGSTLDTTDLAIIRCLHRDPRRSLAKIAKELKIPDSTVRHRLGRLTRRGILEFSAVSNPLNFGYQIWAIIEIQAELPRIRDVAHRLADMPEVYFVGIMAGGYDVNVAAVFRSNLELVDFITRRLSKVSGIVRTTTATVLELVKRTMSFGWPNDVMPSPARRAKQRRRSSNARWSSTRKKP